MTWFYALNGSRIGPHHESEIQELINANTIRSDTLIWSVGYDDWFPASHYFRFPQAAATSHTPMTTPAVQAPPSLDRALQQQAATTPQIVSEEAAPTAEDYAFQEVVARLQSGGRYVYYTYTFSIIILTFTRSSKVQFIPAGQSRVLAGLPYATISFLFGWWGFPFGLILTPFALVKTLAGGTDATKQIIDPSIMDELDIPKTNDGLRILAASIVVFGSIGGLLYWLIHIGQTLD